MKFFFYFLVAVLLYLLAIGYFNACHKVSKSEENACAKTTNIAKP